MVDDQDPEGFAVPFHASLAEPIMLGGVPRGFAILNGVLTLELTIGMGVWWLGIPLGIVLHSISFALHKRDPYFFDTLLRHVRQKEHWEA